MLNLTVREMQTKPTMRTNGTLHSLGWLSKNKCLGALPGGPVVQIHVAIGAGAGLIPGQRTQIPQLRIYIFFLSENKY